MKLLALYFCLLSFAINQKLFAEEETFAETTTIALSRANTQNSLDASIVVKTRTFYTYIAQSYQPPANPTWSGFYTAKKNDKAHALSMAFVLMIHEDEAENILESKNNYFHTKPRNWEEFVAEVMKLDTDDTVYHAHTIAQRLLEKGNEHQIRYHLLGRPEELGKVYLGERSDETILHIKILGANFQPNESEQLFIKMNENMPQFEFESKIHDYDIVQVKKSEAGEFDIVVSASRKAVLTQEMRPDSHNPLRITKVSRTADQKMRVALENSSENDGAGGYTEARISVYKSTYFNPNELVHTQVVKLKKNEKNAEFELSIVLEKTNYHISVENRRLGSSVYGDDWSGTLIWSQDIDAREAFEGSLMPIKFRCKVDYAGIIERRKRHVWSSVDTPRKPKPTPGGTEIDSGVFLPVEVEISGVAVEKYRQNARELGWQDVVFDFSGLARVAKREPRELSFLEKLNGGHHPDAWEYWTDLKPEISYLEYPFFGVVLLRSWNLGSNPTYVQVNGASSNADSNGNVPNASMAFLPLPSDYPAPQGIVLHQHFGQPSQSFSYFEIDDSRHYDCNLSYEVNQ